MDRKEGSGRGAGRRPSIREVAETAGVAVASVSRVLSGEYKVSKNLRQRVLGAVEELGYEPDFLAQGLRRGRTRTVGLLFADIANPAMAEHARGAEEVLRAAGYSMLVMNSDNDPQLDVAHLRILESRRVDGLILSTADERDAATIEALCQLALPVVLLDRDVPDGLEASAVLVNHRPSMAAAVEHLLALGHRRIGLLSWPLRCRPPRERIAGLEDGYAKANLPDESIVIAGPMTPEEAEAETDRLLDLPNPPTALIAAFNQLVLGCLQAIRRRGLQLGVDISLVACDNGPWLRMYSPPIASIDRDNIELGRRTAELLLRRLNGRSEPELAYIDTWFVPRESCGPPRTLRSLGQTG